MCFYRPRLYIYYYMHIYIYHISNDLRALDLVATARPIHGPQDLLSVELQRGHHVQLHRLTAGGREGHHGRRSAAKGQLLDHHTQLAVLRLLKGSKAF